MATKAGVGMSRHHIPNIAGREAAEQALQKTGVSKPDFVLVFGSMGYDQPSLVRAVREATGGAPLTGCSAEGTIDGDDADESNFSVVVTAISSDDLQWHHGIAAGLEAEPRAVGKRVAKDLLPHLSTDTIGLFVFPDGLKDFEYVSWLHHEAEVVREPAESVVRGAVKADPDDEYLVGLAGTLGGGDSYLLSVDRHLLDLPDRALKDSEGRTLARILTPGAFLREIEQEYNSG